MHPSKMRILKAQTPSKKTLTLKKEYNFELSHSQGLTDLIIHANNLTAATSLGPYKYSGLGDLTSDGRYILPLHCHGENMMSGEEFAAAVLAAAEQNEHIEASLDGYMLTFSLNTNCSLFAPGRIRGASSEVLTLMFKISAPDESGSALDTGIGFTYTSGSQVFTFDNTSAEESVYAIGTSNATRQVNGIQISTTYGKTRIIDIRSFGVFRGTVTADAHSPYWGDRVDLFLGGPLINYSPAIDIAYPYRGYAERWVDRVPLSSAGLIAVDVGASYPTYQIEIPEAYRERAKMRLDHFSNTTNENTFRSYTFRCMRSTDGSAFLITASNNYKTLEEFSSLFDSLGVHIQIPRDTPWIETFEKIAVPTRKGKNYLDIETLVTPNTIDFTYY